MFVRMCKEEGLYNAKGVRSKLLYRPRTALALQKHYKPIAEKVGKFMAEDIRASEIEKKSGHSVEQHRISALKSYLDKHKEPFEHELCYDFLKGRGKFLIDFVQTLRNDYAEGEGPPSMAKGSVPGGDPKKKRRKMDIFEEDEEKTPGHKLSRSLLREAQAAKAEDVKHKERVALEQEKYTQKSAMQQLLF